LIDQLLTEKQFSIAQATKQSRLLPEFVRLTEHHRQNCAEYGRILAATGRPEGTQLRSLEDVPFLPVSLFKSHLIKSIPDEAVSAMMTSSGTTGQAVSRIALDRETAGLQTKALASVLGHELGKQRLPMLIVDSQTTIKDPRLISARGAGILGLMRFGRDHTFLLDSDMNPDPAVLDNFLNRYSSAPFLVFGFTFMVWKYLFELVRDRSVDLSNGIMIHSGGWKKLTEFAVDNSTFRAEFDKRCGLKRIYNFYGMVEQMGSIFLEGDDGLLYAPNFVDVIVRDPITLAPVPRGHQGLVQVLSLVPRSYPGHSLLTEDIGVIEAVDSGIAGRQGSGLRIVGRAPKTELRGCSDTHAYNRPQAAA
jgi:hypothetical protein